MTDLVQRVPGITHAIVVSENGALLAKNRGVPNERAKQLAEMAAGVASLAQAASRAVDGGQVRWTVVEMAAGTLLLAAFGHGTRICALASPDGDLALAQYEMETLARRVGGFFVSPAG